MHLAGLRARSTLLAVVASFAACELPTQLPRYDTQWDLLAVSDSIATADLLPEHLRVSAEGFVIDSFTAEGEVRLRDVCELCTCFQGPIPAVQITPTNWPVPLPAGVLSAKLERGTAHVVLHNLVGFDVLNDGDGNKGFFIVDLMDPLDEEVLRQVVLVDRFPPGDSLQLSFDLTDLAVSNRLVARLSGYMPGSGCKDVVLTPESGFRARVRLENVVASSVEVWVGDGALRIPERSFALPRAVAKRLRSGEAHLTLEVEVDTRIPAEVEIGMSAAGRREELFTQGAALWTPLLIPAGAPGAPHAVRKLYVIQLNPLAEADRLFLDTRSRFLLPRPMVLRGGESVAYRVRLRAVVPSR